MKPILILTILIVQTAFSQKNMTITGQVIEVIDGDTIRVSRSSNVHTIKLAGIDAPEQQQPFGPEAKKHLFNLIFRKKVVVHVYKNDKHERFVGKLVLNGRDINLQMLKDGFAWHYKKYHYEQSTEDRIRYSESEKTSRNLSKGLWAEKKPIAPWVWRIQIKKLNQETRKQSRQKSRLRPLFYIRGPRGGCYYITSGGNKRYVNRSLCGQKLKPRKGFYIQFYIRGPRGGCYYINRRGKKQYVKRSLC